LRTDSPGAGIIGMGFSVPDRVVLNADLERLVDTSDEWIRSRTGISERRVASANETTGSLALSAARAALEDGTIATEDVDLILVATSSPDNQLPSTAALLQHELGCQCAALDLGAGCSGFVYALIVARQFIETGAARRVLVVGAEVLSRLVDWSDRNTCVLFGDGAGATVLGPVERGSGMLGFDWGADGGGGLHLQLPLSGAHDALFDAAPLQPRYITQNGREVYRFAIMTTSETSLRALQNSGLRVEDLDLFVPHQANIRIIEEAALRLCLPPEKVFSNIARYGNTSAASIPIALCEARGQGRVRLGDHLLLTGFGAGLTWASCVLKWDDRVVE